MKSKILFSILCGILVCASYAQKSPETQPRNVILIIPDGCSTASWAAVRAATVGVDGILNSDRLPVQGRCKTYSADSNITDSAAAATAYACGVKTNNGVLGMDASTTRGDSLTGKSALSILELAEKAGYTTGLVTTAMIQHATPAGFYTHRAERDWYELIADDLPGKGIEVLLAGGRETMIPKGTADEEGGSSQRDDSRNLIEEMERAGYTYVSDEAGFSKINSSSTDKLLGLFDAHFMKYEYDRAGDPGGEPSLWEMTAKSLDIVSKNNKGFFLMVEAGLIDQAAHRNDPKRWLWDCIACDKAIGVAREFAVHNPNTLLIVVNDHGTGGPNVVGYHPSASQDTVLTEEAGRIRYTLDKDGFPSDFDTKPMVIGWASSPYSVHYSESSGEHTGEDALIQAMGPDSELLGGVHENTEVFTVMRKHLGL